MSGRRDAGDAKTTATIFIMVVFMGIVVFCLITYFSKREAIKVDGGKVNPYTSDFKSIDLGDFGIEGLDEHGNPDTELLGSQFKDLMEEMGQ